MSDNKKYYYLKLKENFFDSDEMVLLESMPDGYIYSNILLKLYLRSLKQEGKLMFNDRIPFNSTMLATITRHSVGVVEKAIKIFQDLQLMEVLDNGAIYMSDIQNFIGKSSTEADRKREYRQKIDAEKQQLLLGGQMSDKCPDKYPPELEIELEIELETEINNTAPKKSPKPSTKELTERFNVLWSDYPNKKGKDKAFKAYQKAVKDGVTDDEIKQGIANYNKEIEIKQTDKQYIAYGSTWFGNQRWRDEYDTTPRGAAAIFDPNVGYDDDLGF